MIHDKLTLQEDEQLGKYSARFEEAFGGFVCASASSIHRERRRLGVRTRHFRFSHSHQRRGSDFGGRL